MKSESEMKARFNRSMVELKERAGTDTLDSIRRFNRSMVELKGEAGVVGQVSNPRFNRSMVELKVFFSVSCSFFSRSIQSIYGRIESFCFVSVSIFVCSDSIDLW